MEAPLAFQDIFLCKLYMYNNMWQGYLTWNSSVFGFAMCTALDDDNGFLSFSDTSSREHCEKMNINVCKIWSDTNHNLTNFL